MRVREYVALFFLALGLVVGVGSSVFITVYRFRHPHMTETELFLYIAPVLVPAVAVCCIAVAFLPKRGR